MGIRRIFKNFQSSPEDLGVMLEFWNTDSELLLYILTGCRHSQAPQASCGEKRTERWKRVRAQKTCALREGLRYAEVGVVPIEHLAANSRKKINTVKQPIYTIWPKWSKCYRMNIPLVWKRRSTGSFVSLNCSGIEAFVLSAYFIFVKDLFFKSPCFGRKIEQIENTKLCSWVDSPYWI